MSDLYSVQACMYKYIHKQLQTFESKRSGRPILYHIPITAVSPLEF